MLFNLYIYTSYFMAYLYVFFIINLSFIYLTYIYSDHTLFYPHIHFISSYFEAIYLFLLIHYIYLFYFIIFINTFIFSSTAGLLRRLKCRWLGVARGAVVGGRVRPPQLDAAPETL